jgi:hypothetical protein
MKKLLLLLASSLLVFTGCSTVNSRIKEKSAYFNTLDGQTQSRLKEGIVKIGDLSDMVYIALGRPDRVRERTSGAGQETTWIYNSYYQEYEGTTFVGYERHGFYDRRNRVWRSYYRPVHADVYHDHVEEYMRVVFRDGKVVSIEQENQN